MSSRSVSELLSEYTLVLRGSGLTEVGIARLHDAPEPGPDESIHDVLEQQVSGTPTEAQLFSRLGKTIVDSERGVEAPGEYWNSAPEVHLRELLLPYGLELSFEPTRYADSIADGTFDIHLTDADGNSYRTRFSYPDTALGDDNYPALLHTIEEDLLSAAGLTFVRLRSPTGRWRFMMLTTDQRDALQNRYGERIEVLGEPLLAKTQLEAFVDEETAPVPEWYTVEETTESTGPDIDAMLAEEDSVETIEVPSDEDVAAPELEGVETDEEIVQAVQPDSPGQRTTAAATGGGGVEASDDELQSVFGDLSDVSLEAATDGGASTASTPAENGEISIDGSATDHTGDEQESIDELFDEIEREVASRERDAGLDGNDDASVAQLVADEGGTAPAATTENGTAVTEVNESHGLETLADADENEAHEQRDHGDGSSGQDTTASELFDRLNQKRRDRA